MSAASNIKKKAAAASASALKLAHEERVKIAAESAELKAKKTEGKLTPERNIESEDQTTYETSIRKFYSMRMKTVTLLLATGMASL
mmetsp:Transcript_33827/g.69146  ORF Transcript_33827/g.69146 Transcript_33827/m.69146 type:complete len:86 (+) Transcript_33827:1127-1384(+)|eukprot:CAMPEP_0171664330 /NCGR_PEP_ID=MMETSP0990-20121206/46719_1 /TAXON_ID=483369 /ORGANISM="non described non described, Strain CCMP2098" /LENGTH=85 /DNA_ID=CAMNT_0012247187 /DNA_START=929 /DNA_END=1186 /DNA_ORIENTATION=-